MKYNLLVLLFAWLLLGCERPAEQTAGEAGANAQPAVQVDIQPATHEELHQIVREADAEVVVVNFWASWCVPCREEFPDFIRLREAYAGRGIKVVFVSADFIDDLPLAESFLREQGVTWRTYLKQGPDAEFIDAFHANWSGALPATFLYDGGGNLRDFWEGKIAYEPLRERVLGVLQR